MKQEKPDHIIQYYFIELGKYLPKIKRDFNKDDIHRFRVNVKKLRALLRMIRLRSKEPGQLKYSRQFKKAYTTLGKIRDRQLFLERFKKTGKNVGNNTIQALKSEIKKLSDNKCDFPERKDLIQMEKNITDHLPMVSNALVKDFMRQKQNIIRGIIEKGVYNDKEMHSIRKCLKDMVYIAKISGEELNLPVPFVYRNEGEIKKTEELLDKLGLFNDTTIALSFLTPADIRDAGTKGKKDLLVIRRQWLVEKRRLKKEILKDMPMIRWVGVNLSIT